MFYRIRVVAKKFESTVDETEPVYGTKYKMEKIPEEKLQVSLYVFLWQCGCYIPTKL